MNRWLANALVLGALGALAACGNEAPASSTGATGTATAAGMATGAKAALLDTDVPVPADYEDKAEKTIDAANYKAALDELEGEIKD